MNSTFRFLGSMTRNLCEGVYFFLPFIRPSENEKPVRSQTPYQEYQQRASSREFKRPLKSEIFSKDEAEPQKSSPLSDILRAIKPAVEAIKSSAHIIEPEKKHEERVTQPLKPVEGTDYLKGIHFRDSSEALSAGIYVKDFCSRSPRMRKEALAQIERLPKHAAVEILKRLLDGEKDALIQMELLDGLSGLNDDGQLDKRLFKDYLKNGNAILRLAAVRAFSKYHDEENFTILSTMMHDSDPEIRKRALSALIGSYEKRCVPVVLHALGDSDSRVRKTAAFSCGILKIKQSISALISLLNDPEREVQKAANESLKKITSEDFGFNPNGSTVNKREAVESWRFWWRDHQSSFGLLTLNDAR